MKSSPLPVLNRTRWCVLWIALIGCGPPAWRGGIHAYLAWSPSGVRVVEVPPDSPAGKGGLLAEDRVLTIDGRPTEGMTSEQVQDRLSGEVGSTVVLEVLRGDKELELYVTREPYAKPSDRSPAAQRGY
ncbi:MAG TPA: PDZ domain-containing protein [Polyangiales bacterium]|nr:PDZ domain-containing protein [Polyangiales bacterium]